MTLQRKMMTDHDFAHQAVASVSSAASSTLPAAPSVSDIFPSSPEN